MRAASETTEHSARSCAHSSFCFTTHARTAWRGESGGGITRQGPPLHTPLTGFHSVRQEHAELLHAWLSDAVHGAAQPAHAARCGTNGRNLHRPSSTGQWAPWALRATRSAPSKRAARRARHRSTCYRNADRRARPNLGATKESSLASNAISERMPRTNPRGILEPEIKNTVRSVMHTSGGRTPQQEGRAGLARRVRCWSTALRMRLGRERVAHMRRGLSFACGCWHLLFATCADGWSASLAEPGRMTAAAAA